MNFIRNNEESDVDCFWKAIVNYARSNLNVLLLKKNIYNICYENREITDNIPDEVIEQAIFLSKTTKLSSFAICVLAYERAKSFDKYNVCKPKNELFNRFVNLSRLYEINPDYTRHKIKETLKLYNSDVTRPILEKISFTPDELDYFIKYVAKTGICGRDLECLYHLRKGIPGFLFKNADYNYKIRNLVYYPEESIVEISFIMDNEEYKNIIQL